MKLISYLNIWEFEEIIKRPITDILTNLEPVTDTQLYNLLDSGKSMYDFVPTLVKECLEKDDKGKLTYCEHKDISGAYIIYNMEANNVSMQWVLKAPLVIDEKKPDVVVSNKFGLQPSSVLEFTEIFGVHPFKKQEHVHKVPPSMISAYLLGNYDYGKFVSGLFLEQLMSSTTKELLVYPPTVSSTHIFERFVLVTSNGDFNIVGKRSISFLSTKGSHPRTMEDIIEEYSK